MNHTQIIKPERRVPRLADKRIHYITTDDIAPNPSQPRTNFDEEAIIALSESILQYGFIQPLVVKLKSKARHFELNGQNVKSQKYELVSGERRFRAARRLNLKSVPCMIVRADSKDSAIMAISENMIREGLNFFEEAAAIYNALMITGMTQSKLAGKLAISQSALANKLRLLKLSTCERQAILENNLSERHARALIRLDDQTDREYFISYCIENKLPSTSLDFEIDKFINSKINFKNTLFSTFDDITNNNDEKAGTASTVELKKKRIVLMKDLTFFFNSINNSVKMVTESGFNVVKQTNESDNIIEINIKIKKDI